MYGKCMMKCLLLSKGVYVDRTKVVHEKIMELLPKLKELLPANNEYNDNCKKWIFANIAMS